MKFLDDAASEDANKRLDAYRISARLIRALIYRGRWLYFSRRSGNAMPAFDFSVSRLAAETSHWRRLRRSSSACSWAWYLAKAEIDYHLIGPRLYWDDRKCHHDTSPSDYAYQAAVYNRRAIASDQCAPSIITSLLCVLWQRRFRRASSISPLACSIIAFTRRNALARMRKMAPGC